MTFYRPKIAQVTSWTFAASPGESATRTVFVPPISTTQAAIFTAFTGVTNGVTMFLGGGGQYYSSTGTWLNGGVEMDTSGMAGSFQRYAHCGMIGDAVRVAAGTPLAPYLADGASYFFTLDGTDGAFPLTAHVSAVLTIVVLDGPFTYTPSPRPAATVTSAHYGYTSGTGTSTGSVNVWMDAFYPNGVHLFSAWGASAAASSPGNWWPAGEAFQPAANGLPSVYQSVAVAANSPAASSPIASPVAYSLSPTEQWAIMAYESDVVPTAYVAPVAVPARLATIVG